MIVLRSFYFGKVCVVASEQRSKGVGSGGCPERGLRMRRGAA